MSKRKKTSVAEKVQQKLAQQGKNVSVAEIQKTLEANASAKRAKRQAKGQQLKDYAKFRVDRAKKMAETGVDLVKGFKNPANWVQAGKNILEGEVENVKKLKDLINHPSYYEHYQSLLDNMITPNFGKISGVVDPDIPMSTDEAGYIYPFFTGDCSVARVAGINLLLVRGSDSHEFMIGIDRLYQIIQNINNGNAIGTLEDLAAYVLNFRAVIAGIEQGRRAYGALPKFELLDESVPMTYFAAFGLDYDSFKDNSGNLRQNLNKFIDELNNRAMFQLDLFERTKSLFSTSYADNPTDKRSEYVFRPLSVEYVDENKNISSISLCNDAVGAHNTGLDYSTWLSYMKTLMKSLYANDMYKNLRANIIKAEGLNIFSLSLVNEDYVFPTIYDEYMLTQIQNATLIGEGVAYTSNIVGTNYSNLISTDEVLDQASYSNFAENYLHHVFINIYKNKISNSEFISNTRLCALGKLGDGAKIEVDIFGTEVACEIVIPMVTLNAAAVNKDYDISLFRLHRFLNYATHISSQLKQIMFIPYLWSIFDWMPMVGFSILQWDSKEEEIIWAGYSSMWDYANYATLNRNESSLKFYHGVAIRNLLFSPLRYQQKKTEVIPTK